MTVRRLEITLNEETSSRLDAARGFEPRASFVKRALEQALGVGEGVGIAQPSSRSGGGTSPAPVRASARETGSGSASSHGMAPAPARPSGRNKLAADVAGELAATPLPKIAPRRSG